VHFILCDTYGTKKAVCRQQDASGSIMIQSGNASSSYVSDSFFTCFSVSTNAVVTSCKNKSLYLVVNLREMMMRDEDMFPYSDFTRR